MSDPAKSASEIEDVLASIRRLVSESQTQPVRPTATAPVRAADTPVRSGKLVLTPALRVTDPDDPWAPVPVTDEAAPATGATGADGDADTDASWGLEDRLSDWGEIEDSADEAVADAIAERQAPPFHRASPLADASTDNGMTVADAEPDAADLADLAALDGAGAGDLADFEPETGDADWPDRSAGSALRDLALARGRGLADGECAEDDMVEDDTPGETMRAPPEDDATDAPHDHGAAHPATETERPTQDEAASNMTPEPPPASDEARTGRTPIFSRRLDVKRASAPQDHPDAADGAAADPVDRAGSADTTSAYRAHVPEDDDVEDLGEATSPFTFPETEDGLLDEETLRDIIAEVVREELQGALGQRITRNVRKMVRREIRLALAAEDLE